MTALRWFLGITAIVAAAGWVALAVWADGFRRSFGASEVGALRTAAPPLALLLALLTVLMPAKRLLLHAAALVFTLVAVRLVFVLRESILTGLAGFFLVCAWFVFYWLALRS